MSTEGSFTLAIFDAISSAISPSDACERIDELRIFGVLVP
jgi:hypothetical protein